MLNPNIFLPRGAVPQVAPKLGPPGPTYAPMSVEDFLTGVFGMKPYIPPAPVSVGDPMSAPPLDDFGVQTKKRDLLMSDLKDSMNKSAETVKRKPYEPKMKTTFGKKDLPIALIGGLLAYLAGGKDPGRSVNEFVQSFSAFNKQSADEHNQMEMQKVQQEERERELELASQRIGIDIKKLDLDQQNAVLERVRADQERQRDLEDRLKLIEAEGAKQIKVGETLAPTKAAMQDDRQWATAKERYKQAIFKIGTLPDLKKGELIAKVGMAKSEEELLADPEFVASIGGKSIQQLEIESKRALREERITDLQILRPFLEPMAKLNLEFKQTQVDAAHVKYKYLEQQEFNKVLIGNATISKIWNDISSKKYNDELNKLKYDAGRLNAYSDNIKEAFNARNSAIVRLTKDNMEDTQALSAAKQSASMWEAQYNNTKDEASKTLSKKEWDSAKAEVARIEKEIKDRDTEIGLHQQNIDSMTTIINKINEDMSKLPPAPNREDFSGINVPAEKYRTTLESAYAAGFRGEALATALAVAMAESGGNAKAHNPNASTGDNSYGLWQINMLGNMGPERRSKYGLKSNEDLWDPVTNAKIAYKMSGGGKNWNAWTTYTSGKYLRYMDDARRIAGLADKPATPPETPKQEYQDRPVRGGPIPMASGKSNKNNPNLQKAASGLKGGGKSNKSNKSSTGKTRTVKVGDKTVTITEK